MDITALPAEFVKTQLPAAIFVAVAVTWFERDRSLTLDVAVSFNIAATLRARPV